MVYYQAIRCCQDKIDFVGNNASIIRENNRDQFMSEPKKIVIKINRASKQKKVTSSNSMPGQITVWNIKRIVGALIVILLLIVIPFSYLGNGRDDAVKDNSAETDAATVQKKLEPEISTIRNKKPELPIGNRKQEQSLAHPANKAADAIVNTPVNKPSAESAETLSKPTVKSAKPDKPIVQPIKKQVPGGKPKISITHYKVTRALLARGISNKEPFGEINAPIKVKNKTVGIFYFTEIKGMKGRNFYHQWLREGKLVFKRPITVLGNRWRVSTSKLFTPSSKGSWTVRLTDKAGRIYNEINFEVLSE